MTAVVRAAEELAASGVPVFPVLENKRPACGHGFKDAVCTPAEAAALWSRHPGPLIGVPTGEASGIDALDIDPRHNGDRWWLKHSTLIPQTRMHRTRSNGLHALFRHAPYVRNSESRIAPGVDTRGEGGYIVWWPATGCRIVDAPIIPWPDWLLTTLARQAEREKQPARSFVSLDDTDAVQRAADRVLRRIARAGQGQRYYELRKGAYTIGGLLHLLPFGEVEALDRLVKAAEDAGAEDSKHARRIASWGLGHGIAAPLSKRERR